MAAHIKSSGIMRKLSKEVLPKEGGGDIAPCCMAFGNQILSGIFFTYESQ
jgi:hypothetical protein